MAFLQQFANKIWTAAAYLEALLLIELPLELILELFDDHLVDLIADLLVDLAALGHL